MAPVFLCVWWTFVFMLSKILATHILKTRSGLRCSFALPGCCLVIQRRFPLDNPPPKCAEHHLIERLCNLCRPDQKRTRRPKPKRRRGSLARHPTLDIPTELEATRGADGDFTQLNSNNNDKRVFIPPRSTEGRPLAAV